MLIWIDALMALWTFLLMRVFTMRILQCRLYEQWSDIYRYALLSVLAGGGIWAILFRVDNAGNFVQLALMSIVSSAL